MLGALILGALFIVWYFVIVCAIGWLLKVWPCRECLRKKFRHGSRTHEAR